jgi:hypothetical protein
MERVMEVVWLTEITATWSKIGGRKRKLHEMSVFQLATRAVFGAASDRVGTSGVAYAVPLSYQRCKVDL